MVFKVGIIGAGVIGTRLAGRFFEHPDFQIAWICDVHKNKALDLARKFEGEPTKDIGDIMKDSDVDLVYIGVPPKFHSELSIEALSASKNVFCEKPLALYNDEVRKMIEASKNSEGFSGVNLPFRWNPAFPEIKKILASKKIGEILKIELKFRFPLWPRKWQQVEWLAKKEQGGPLREVATHYFFGLLELKDFIGVPTKIWSSVKYDPNDACERSCTAILKMSKMINVSIDLLNYSAEFEENTLRIIGDKGVLDFRAWSQLFVKLSGEDFQQVKLSPPTESPLDTISSLLSDFEPKTSLVSFMDAGNAHFILQGVLSSNEQWIPIRENLMI